MFMSKCVFVYGCVFLDVALASWNLTIFEAYHNLR